MAAARVTTTFSPWRSPRALSFSADALAMVAIPLGFLSDTPGGPSGRTTWREIDRHGTLHDFGDAPSGAAGGVAAGSVFGAGCSVFGCSVVVAGGVAAGGVVAGGVASAG